MVMGVTARVWNGPAPEAEAYAIQVRACIVRAERVLESDHMILASDF